ncbi:MAG TPA: CHAD domain-containing protein [Polyangiaceae bacterium]|nr:CHAD domain-containing protein [Polyangiaceae bacterium]
MEDQVTPREPADSSAVLATTIAAQRRVLGGHFQSKNRRLKPKAIHELRVAIRRLLSAFSLCGALGLTLEGRSRRRLRKLLSRLAPARDAHVQLRQLAELLPTHPGTAPLLVELRRQRRVASRRAQKRLQGFALADLDRDVSVVMDALRSAITSSAAVSAAMLGRLAAGHLTVERQLRGASADDPVALHAVRLALKDYRYALEALAKVLPASAQTLAASCEELQGVLGSAHDIHVLARTARELGKRQDSASVLGVADALDELSKKAHAAAAEALGRTRLPWLT